MAGHSHWANIQHSKGAADAKRAKVFSKLSRAIIVAAKHGGGDPETNLKLRYAIDKARQSSMPKDNIERAIKKGTGETEGTVFEEIQYEGYGPGGVAVLVDVFTDNRNRTAGEVRKLFEKAGGKLGSAGCVGYMFERKGLIIVDSSAIDEDTLLGIALDAGADDLKNAGSFYEITCDPHNFAAVKKALEEKNVPIRTSDVTQIASQPVDVDAETGAKIMRLMHNLDDHDDVQNVYSNVNISEEMVARMGQE